VGDSNENSGDRSRRLNKEVLKRVMNYHRDEESSQHTERCIGDCKTSKVVVVLVEDDDRPVSEVDNVGQIADVHHDFISNDLILSE
ncbi:hypothetical protein PFISCL1PPCAC_13770, partial [Pristionchus fissidentatus]